VQASAAGQLFLDRARAASSRFRPDETSAAHIAAICRRLDGLPLAIELAAVRIRDLDVMELAQGLRDTIRVLEQPARGVRQRSLSSAVEWSWQLLDDAERRLLRRLAVLPGEFTLALAEIIGPGPAAVDVRSILMRLVERSLVNMRLTPGEPARYWLLGVIRAAILERADPAADEQVASGHARFFCQVAQDAAYAHCHPASATAVPAGFDQPNILAALAWSAAHDLGLADRLLVSVSRLAEVEPSRQALELIRDVAVGCPSGLSCEALARAAVTVTFLSLDDAGQLARKSGLAAVGDRDNAFVGWASGWVRAYRHEEGAALVLLDRVCQECLRPLAGSLRATGPGHRTHQCRGGFRRLGAGGHQVRGRRRPD
jgi:hypothetical protein